MSESMKMGLDRNDINEKKIEQRLVRGVKAMGGMCPKLVSPGTDGMPDRMVMLPCCRIGFVEVKAPGKKPRPLQVRRHRQIAALGFPVFVLDDPAQISGIIDAIKGGSTLGRELSESGECHHPAGSEGLPGSIPETQAVPE